MSFHVHESSRATSRLTKFLSSSPEFRWDDDLLLNQDGMMQSGREDSKLRNSQFFFFAWEGNPSLMGYSK
jgi:hypothetical protein